VRVSPLKNDMLLVQVYYQCMHMSKLAGFTPGFATLSFPAHPSDLYGFTQNAQTWKEAAY